jgi:hypothetical protein
MGTATEERPAFFSTLAPIQPGASKLSYFFAGSAGFAAASAGLAAASAGLASAAGAAAGASAGFGASTLGAGTGGWGIMIFSSLLQAATPTASRAARITEYFITIFPLVNKILMKIF